MLVAKGIALRAILVPITLVLALSGGCSGDAKQPGLGVTSDQALFAEVHSHELPGVDPDVASLLRTELLGKIAGSQRCGKINATYHRTNNLRSHHDA